MPGLLCVSVYVLLCFRLSYWLDKFQSASVCLGKSCAWSRGSPRRHMKTHSRAHEKYTHAHRPVSRQSHRNQVIEQRPVSRHTRHYWETKDLHEKRDSLPGSLSLCVCVCMCWCICSNTTPRHSEWEPTPSLSRALSRWSQLWRGSRLLPASHRAYKWIYYHSLFIPTILLGMSLARLCNERVHSRVLF